MRATTMRKTALCIAMGLCFGSMSMGALAANNDGSLAGRTTPGAEVTIRSPDTGFTRTVKADEQGNYRFPFLPVGQYTLQTSVGGAASEPTPVTVSLGTTTNVNVGSQAATDLAAVQVVGTRGISPVDVSSTEIATNITREQIDVLPVQRDVVSVALLAPGVVKG